MIAISRTTWLSLAKVTLDATYGGGYGFRMAPHLTLLSIPEASKQFRVAPSTVRRWVKSGRLKAIRLPSGRAKIAQADVEAIMRGEQSAGTA